MEGEFISRRVKVTENTTIAKLGLLDQIKLVFSRFSNNDENELKAATAAARKSLSMQASLEHLFKEATKKMETDGHKSVTLSVSSKYIPYLDVVVDEKYGMGRYYKFYIYKRDLPINVDYKFTVKIERKIT